MFYFFWASYANPRVERRFKRKAGTAKIHGCVSKKVAKNLIGTRKIDHNLQFLGFSFLTHSHICFFHLSLTALCNGGSGLFNVTFYFGEKWWI